ncbi:MAG: SHIRT domain-containing protein [Coprobacillaceae bacterium]
MMTIKKGKFISLSVVLALLLGMLLPTYDIYAEDSNEVVETDEQQKGIIPSTLTREFNTRELETLDSVAHKYDVEYEFKKVGTSRTLPEGVKKKLPEDKKVSRGESVYLPEKFENVNDGNGYWKFKEWNHTSPKKIYADTTFVGTWEYVKLKDTYTGKHEFKSLTEGKKIPQEVLQYLPSDKELQTGEPAEPTYLNKTSVIVKDGRWDFHEWTPTYVPEVCEDVTFTGWWQFDETFSATFEFENEDRWSDYLPKSVKELLPNTITGIERGATFTPTNPAPDGVFIEDEDMLWVFQGWNPIKHSNIKKDISFVGKWKSEKRYRATHTFVKEEGSPNLPKDVMDLKPTDITNLKNGQKIKPNNSTFEPVILDEGTWTFEGWEPESIKVDREDVNFVGTWSYKEHEYKATHTFESTDGKELPTEVTGLLPETISGLKHGDTANPKVTSFKPVVVTEGTWTFEGWEPESIKVDREDVNFIGTWSYKEHEYNRVYRFQCTEGNSVPEVVEKQLPKCNNIYKRGDVVKLNNQQKKT